MTPPKQKPSHLPLKPSSPTHRLLRGYAFDPSMATQLETALVSEIMYRVPWKPCPMVPIGEYVEIVDYDPPSGCFYAPMIHPFWLKTDWRPQKEIHSFINRWSMQ